MCRVTTKAQLISELSALGTAGEAQFTLLEQSKDSNRKCNIEIVLSKSRRSEMQKVLQCLSAKVDGSAVLEGEPLQLAKHYAWPASLLSV